MSAFPVICVCWKDGFFFCAEAIFVKYNVKQMDIVFKLKLYIF